MLNVVGFDPGVTIGHHISTQPHLPAVSLRDLFDGNSDLVADISPGVHHSIGAPPQHHPVTCLIGVILIL